MDPFIRGALLELGCIIASFATLGVCVLVVVGVLLVVKKLFP